MVRKKLASILENLNIDKNVVENSIPKQQTYNKFANNVVPISDYNYQCDLIQFPETKDKYKYLFTMVDIYDGSVDFEPLKQKFAEDAKLALIKIFQRGILKKPKGSIRTDNGKEFQGNFHQFLNSLGIFHKYSVPYRHKQMSPIESLNNSVSILINAYLNAKTKQYDEDYNEWVEILDSIRTELNKYRAKPVDDKESFEKALDKQGTFNEEDAKNQTYKVGDLVYKKLEKPMDILNRPINDTRFRRGDKRWDDRVSRIVKVLYFNDYPYYRYMLNDVPNASYSKYDLKKAKDRQEETFRVKQVIGKTYLGRNQGYGYKLWYSNQTRKEANKNPYQNQQFIEENNLQELVNQYNEKNI
jgi:hypothetical protein